ncbi:MAG: efflux RND transporter permease subunit, partial [Desulfobacterales bacterium]
MKGIISWFAENHVAANLLMIFMIVSGILTIFSIKLEVFPDTAPDSISILAVYPGASPEEVESAVIRRIEEAVAGLAGIKQISSNIRESFGSVYIEVVKDWDLKKLISEVKAAVDSINTFPGEAETPIVRESTRTRQIISIAVYGDVPERTLKHLAENIRDDITSLPGITMAEVSGVRTGEIQVEISEATLSRYRLTLGQVANAIRGSSLDLPAGSIKTAGGEILIRTKGRRYFANNYEDVAIITRPDGTTVTLGQIAEVKEGFEDVDITALFQGKPAATVNVYSVADQNALTVAAAVKRHVEQIEPSLPAGAQVAYYNDSSEILKDRMDLLLRNMGYGLMLVILLLGVFLKWRLAFWVTLGIPISFCAGLIALPQFDISINMVSLFAFIMVLGVVVDDAIIIGENIFRKHEEGLGPLEGTIQGALEVGQPVIFAVLTTIVAFWPLLQGGGMMGKIMRAIPVVVIAVLAASLVECLLILPAHLGRSRRSAIARKGDPNREGHVARGLKYIIRGPYTRLIRFCVQWRYATVSVGLLLLLLCIGLWQGGWIKFIFMPRLEGDFLMSSVTLPVGQPVERTKEVVARLERVAREVLNEADQQRPEGAPPLLKYSSSLIGAQFSGGPMGGSSIGGHLAQVNIMLLSSEQRDISSAELSNRWRKAIGHIPDVESITFSAEMHGAGNAIQVNLSMDDPDRLLVAADQLKAELEKYPGVYDLRDSYQTGKMEMQLKLKPAARSLGLTLNNLAAQVRHAFYGAEALRLQRGEDEVKVIVRYPDAERKSLGDVESMRIRTPTGMEVPFKNVAEVTMKRGYASLQRVQRQRVVTVYGNVDEKIANSNEVRRELVLHHLPQLKSSFPGLRYSMEGEAKEQAESLGDVFRAFIIALFCIYALLA